MYFQDAWWISTYVHQTPQQENYGRHTIDIIPIFANIETLIAQFKHMALCYRISRQAFIPTHRPDKRLFSQTVKKSLDLFI